MYAATLSQKTSLLLFLMFYFFNMHKGQNVRRKINISCFFFLSPRPHEIIFFFYTSGDWFISGTENSFWLLCHQRGFASLGISIVFLLLFLPKCIGIFFFPKGIIGFAPTLSSFGIPKRSLESLACILHLVCSNRDNKRIFLNSSSLPHNCLNYFCRILSGGIEKHSQYGI